MGCLYILDGSTIIVNALLVSLDVHDKIEL